jgi:hypothetical protein
MCARECELMDDTVRANMAPDVSPEWLMREEEITGQLTTFMFAGSDTSTYVSPPIYPNSCQAHNAIEEVL